MVQDAHTSPLLSSNTEDLHESFVRWAANERGWASKTLHDYATAVRAAQRWCTSRGLCLENVTSAELRQYFFTTKLTARTRNSRRNALIAWFDFLVGTDRRPENIAKQLPRLPERRTLPKPIAREAVPGLLAAARAIGAREYLLIAIYLFTGLRLSEVRSLRWPQVADAWLCLPKKGGDERVVWLHDEIREALAAWRPEAPASEFLFPSPVIPDQPLCGAWFERRVKAIGLRAGIPNLRPHRLRHTFGTALYEQTGDVLLVKEALGHASLQSTVIYTEIRPHRVQAAVRDLRFGRDP